MPTPTMSLKDEVEKKKRFTRLGLDGDQLKGLFVKGEWRAGNGGVVTSIDPATGESIATVSVGSKAECYEDAIAGMQAASKIWMNETAVRRGEIVRQIGNALRDNLDDLGWLVSLVMGKIRSEGIGEVQEFIDICDLACGISRQLEGKVLPSERPGHLILECWNPLGCIGMITAFNFPVAVCGWNSALSLICGNCSLWKGADTSHLVSIAVTKIVEKVFRANNLPPAVFSMVCGSGPDIGEAMSADKRLALISFTGSTEIGKKVNQAVSKRLGKVLLELGGNSASVILPDADMDIAIKGSLFGAVGTCGQRCTSLRRLLVHSDVYDKVKQRLVAGYGKLEAAVGDPLDEGTLVGPLHTEASRKRFLDGLEQIKKEGGTILCGGGAIAERKGFYVQPTLVEISSTAPITHTEIFAPIMYLMKIKSYEEAIQVNNQVPQGLSSSLYTKDMSNVFKWIGPMGSDCGLINVNIGTSGAEIGGAFGGEKETGGGREAGSDSWRAYMRRSTCTINHSKDLPLAQGVVFDF